VPRYSLTRVEVEAQNSQAATWVFPEENIRGTEHRYFVVDRNLTITKRSLDA
jgi:hypothetical protein